MITTSRGLRTGNLGISADQKELRADELPFKIRRAILEQEFQDFNQVLVELIKRVALRVRPWESGNVADVQPSVWTAFNNRGVRSHDLSPVADSITWDLPND